MRTIWKYVLPLMPGVFSIEMPQGAKILTVQAQGDEPVLWAEVERGKPKEDRRFVLVGTGDGVPAGVSSYVGTVQFEGGTYVFHLYEWER